MGRGARGRCLRAATAAVPGARNRPPWEPQWRPRSAGLGALLIGAEPSADAVVVSEWMRSAWSAFATTGDPGWPAYDTEQRLTQLIDTEPTVTPYPAETTRRIWADHAFDALPLRQA